jgi:hypothetical protein
MNSPFHCLAVALLFGLAAGSSVLAATPETAPIANRQPLRANPMVPLPLGSVRPAGWLRTELQLQADGLTGHAEELLPGAAPNSGWLGGTGEDWEKGPYYVKGLVPLAYTLDDQALKNKAQKWIDWSLQSQRADGSFGPQSNNEWWPRIVMTYALRQYAEATGDPRVMPFLQKYFHYMLTELPHRPLKEWAKARAGDEIDTVFWLYNRTGDPELLELADLLHAQMYDWTDIFTLNRFTAFGDDFYPRHGVNVTQAMKTPPVWYQRSGAARDRDAFAVGLSHLVNGTTLPLDVLTATEMLSGRSAIQGVETCAVVEQMLSDETAFAILGDARIADALERTAYNAMPGAMTKDLKLYQYYTATNNVMAVRGGHGFDQDYDDGMMPGPISGFPCCCYNLHMGWPMLVQHAWMATADGGLAPVIYGPTEVRTTLPGAGDVRIVEDTNYPFDGAVRLKISLSQPAKFPLKLRIPAWSSGASVKVNDQPPQAAKAGGFVNLDREWNDGDQVKLQLPMRISAIGGVNHSISLARGPLVYSLRLPEHKKAVKPGPDGFVQLEITSPDPWNFALAVDPADPGKRVVVSTTALPEGSPFQADASPIVLKVPGRRVASWRTNWTGRVADDPPLSPVVSSEPEQMIEMVPFGAQTLRVTAFPVLGDPPPARSQYRCEFLDGELPGWVLFGGSWYVNHSRLSTPISAGTAGVKAVVTDTDFSDFVFSAQVQPAPVGDSGLIFRVSRPSLGDNAFDGYYAGIRPADRRAMIGKCSAADNTWTELASANLPAGLDTGAFIALRVVAKGPSIELYAGPRLLLSVHDESFTHGSIGVRRYATGGNGLAQFANIAVKEEGR